MSSVWILGAGGHAKVVIDAWRAASGHDPAGVLDDDPARWGTAVLGVRVKGGLDAATLNRLGVDRAVIAVGSNRARAVIALRLDGRVAWTVVVHPRAYVAAGVTVGDGAVVIAGAVVQPDAAVGAHAILNTGCAVDHDVVIGRFAHLGPGTCLAGYVHVGEGALLGVGACVLPGRAVGAWATVGAGAIVARDVPGGATAVGVPARVTRTGPDV